MDYTNFVKSYYKIAIASLNKFSNFNGSFVNVNYDLDIEPSHFHKKVSNLDILPNFELNIDVPLEDYEKFMEYYSTLYPELGIILANRDDMNKIYSLALSKNILSDETKTFDYINLVINIAIDLLKQQGILK